MDPQIEEYRRKQRERAASAGAATNKSVGGMKPSYLLVGGLIVAAALVSVGRTQSKPPAAGMCPKPSGVGICVEECSTHDDCQGQGKLCCSNGCGHVCMDPEVPGSVPDKQCTLMVTLASEEDSADKVLAAVPKPSTHSHLAAVGIVILDYAVGRSSDCCAAEQALLAMPDVAKSVEYDGAKPGCASESSSEPMIVEDNADFVESMGTSEEPMVGEPMMGAYGGSSEVDEDSLAVWNQVLAKSPVHKEHDLKALGKPVSVKEQVVAGTNYIFSFKGGASVTVFHQPWTDTLEVAEVHP